MPRVWQVVLASALVLSALLAPFLGAEASPGGGRVTLDLIRGYALSFELPEGYQVTKAGSSVSPWLAEGPPIEETLTNKDGARETSFFGGSSPILDDIDFGAWCGPARDHRDLSVLMREEFSPIYEEGTVTWDWGAVYREGAVTVPGDNGVSYPGYYALIYTELEATGHLTEGFLVVLVEPDCVACFWVGSGGPRDWTPWWGTYTYTVSGQPLVAKHKADVAAMIASVRITRGPTPPTPTPTPADENSFTGSVPLPSQLSTDPGVIGTNVGLAILTVLIFYLAATIFNSTLKENYEIIQGWLRRASKRLRFLSTSGSEMTGDRRGYKPKLRAYLEGTLVVAICALIYWFLNPYFTNGLRGIALFISLALGIAIATYSYDGTQVLVTTRRFHVPAGIRIYPIAIPIAVIFVVLSNAIHFHPGLIYGFVGGYAVLSVSNSKNLDRGQRAITILYGTLAILVISLGAFFFRELLYNLAWREGNFWRYLVEDILVAAIAIGLEGLVFSLAVPLSFLDGGKLRAWKLWVWLLAALAVAFVFFYIIINKDHKLVEAARSMKVITMYILMGLSLVVSIGTWLYFKWRPKQTKLIRSSG